MEGLVKGDVVVLPFPFSDLSASKKRPALVVAVLAGDDCILAQITSQERKDADALELLAADFDAGSLPHASNVRPNKLFTADRHLVDYVSGRVRMEKLDAVIDAICAIVRR